jgi:hypothetical protein
MRWNVPGLLVLTLVGIATLCVAGDGAARAAGSVTAPKRVTVSGEIIDSWCQVSGIMGVALGTAHHQCAVWCAVGGVPVGIQGDDGMVYILLRVPDDRGVVGNPTVVDMQTEHVTADADYYERDGVNYLVVNRILADDGIINRNHKELGILPFGE